MLVSQPLFSLLRCCWLVALASVLTSCQSSSPSRIAISSTTAPIDLNSPSLKASPRAFVDGWVEIAGKDVSLYLPPSYSGANPADNNGFSLLSQRLTKFNPQAATALKSFQAGVNDLNLIAFDVGDDNREFVTNATVMVQTLDRDRTFDRFVSQSIADLTHDKIKVERAILSVDRYTGVRLIARTDRSKVAIVQLIYLIPQGQRVWMAVYSTTASQFDRRLPQFEQSIQTIDIDRVAN